MSSPVFPKRYADIVQRLRVPSGFLLLAAFAWLAKPNPASIAAGTPICIAGLLLRAWAAGHLAKNEALATSGPYAYIRNPLYAGTLLAVTGLAVAANHITIAVAGLAVFALVYWPVMEQEEQHLRKLFPAYSEYAERVPLLMPRGRRSDARAQFRTRLYLRNQEYQAAAGFAAGLLFLLWRAGLFA
jgi:protein-S-isoprenylcysteine O-methyltransferase Ste14